MSTLTALIVAAVFCMALALFLGITGAFKASPKQEPSPRDLEPWGDWPHRGDEL
ncbi:MAG TPA: hypothetical protein VHL98_10865 [Microvirga sp.]|jgi:hypothetical protein|nr:hypothetical protein [Microvirga sp.]